MSLPIVLIFDGACKDLVVHHEIMVVDEKSMTVVVAKHLELLQVRRRRGSCLRRPCISLVGESVGVESIPIRRKIALSTRRLLVTHSGTKSTIKKKVLDQ